MCQLDQANMSSAQARRHAHLQLLRNQGVHVGTGFENILLDDVNARSLKDAQVDSESVLCTPRTSFGKYKRTTQTGHHRFGILQKAANTLFLTGTFESQALSVVGWFELPQGAFSGTHCGCGTRDASRPRAFQHGQRIAEGIFRYFPTVDLVLGLCDFSSPVLRGELFCLDEAAFK